MLSPDVRLEGFTAEDWTRLLQLFKPAPSKTASLGGLFVIHEAGEVRKMLHTRRGRLEREGEWRQWPDVSEGQRTKRLAALAEAHQASWVVAAEVGTLEEVMERFGARARREDDLVAQALSLITIVRELMTARRIEGWPRRLKNVPVPTQPMIRRALDAVCKESHAIALGVFKDGALWTALVVRRAARGFDLVAGPDELRRAMGLISWRVAARRPSPRRRGRRSLRAVGVRLLRRAATLSTLQADARPGAWSRAVAVRDVILSPMPLAIGVALGLDGARYAWSTVRSVTPTPALFHAPLAVFEPAVQALRKRVSSATDKDIASVLGFSPLEVLRALRRRD